MIIDFHTHTFPEKIAEKALNNLSNTSRAVPYTDGTASCRLNSMKNALIDISNRFHIIGDVLLDSIGSMQQKTNLRIEAPRAA